MVVDGTTALPRRLDIARDLRSRSVFLFGPRQTGKTTWLRRRFPGSRWFNLLHGDVFLRLSREPGRLRAELAAESGAANPVIIDEIQKLPSLLDDVHDLMESRGLRFVLAASSPAKLRRGGVNLLGGRARTRRLFPFVSAEVPAWDLLRAINVGGIPSIYFSSDPVEDLRAYCGSYLQLEVQAEGLVRGIEPFSRFLAAAAVSRGQPIVFETPGLGRGGPRAHRPRVLPGAAGHPARHAAAAVHAAPAPPQAGLPRQAVLLRRRRRQSARRHHPGRSGRPDIRIGAGTADLLRADRLALLRARRPAADLLAHRGRYGVTRCRRCARSSSTVIRSGHVPAYRTSSAIRRRRLNSARAVTTASRLVFARVKRMASASSSSGISIVVFTKQF